MRVRMLGLFSTLLLLFALPAAALPGISLSEPLPVTGPDECPVLMQIKFPWLICKTDADGFKRVVNTTVPANASWEADRRMPLGYEFIEGDGGWKPITR